MNTDKHGWVQCNPDATMASNNDLLGFIRVHLCSSVFQGLLAASLSLPTFAANPERPLIPLYTAAEIPTKCDEGLAQARAMIAKMESTANADTFFDEWNRLQIAIQDTSNPIGFIANVDPDKAVRGAAEACTQKYSRLGVE